MAADDDEEVTPPGWYRQADDPTSLRWWDGDDWTDETMPVPAAAGGRSGRAQAAKKAAAAAPAAPAKRRTRADVMAEAEAEARRAAEPEPEPGPTAADEPPARRPAARAGRGTKAPARGATQPGRGAAQPARRAVHPLPSDTDGLPPAVEILVDPGSPGSDGREEAPRTPRRRPTPDPDAGPGYVRTQPATVRVLGDDLADLTERPRRRRDPAQERAEARPGPRTTRPPGTRPPARSGAPAGRRPTIDEDRPRSGARGARVAEPEERAAPPVLKVLGRALIIAVVLAGAFVGYVKLRDAQPNAAATLPDEARAQTVDPDAPRLDQIVLTLADLPRGWSAQAVDPTSDDICDDRVPRSVLEPIGIQNASFNLGDTGAFIGNTVEEFVNARTAQAYMDLTAEVVDSCREYTANDSTISLAPFDFPAFGDETFAAQLSGTAPGGELHGALVYVRVGNRVASVISITFGEGEVNEELVEHLTQLVARRMTTKPELGGLPGE